MKIVEYDPGGNREDLMTLLGGLTKIGTGVVREGFYRRSFSNTVNRRVLGNSRGVKWVSFLTGSLPYVLGLTRLGLRETEVKGGEGESKCDDVGGTQGITKSLCGSYEGGVPETWPIRETDRTGNEKEKGVQKWVDITRVISGVTGGVVRTVDGRRLHEIL